MLKQTTRGWRPSEAGQGAPQRAASPTARKSAYERLLRNAISGRWLIELRGADVAGWRRFAPHAMFRSAAGHINVSVIDPAISTSGDGTGAAEVLEIGRIVGLRLVDEQFDPSPLFDRASALYEGGVICSV